MIITDKYKHGIHFYNVWFADELIRRPGIYQYRQANFVNKGFGESNTIINDIQKDDDAILSTFSKSCRYKVNRGSREDIGLEFYTGKEVGNELIDSFVSFFEQFWISKGSILQEPGKIREALYQYREIDALSITCAIIGGNKVVYHVYIMDDKRARLLHSASLYRTEEESDSKTKNLIGIANRYLHYKEMLYYRDKGIKEYDWGGAGRSEEVIRITEFKESFGGYIEKSYSGEMAIGIKAHLFKLLVKILK